MREDRPEKGAEAAEDQRSREKRRLPPGTIAVVVAGAAAAAAAGITVVKLARRGRGRSPSVLHVAPEGEGWELGLEGEDEADRFATKREAVARGRELAREHAPSELVIHRADGSVQDRHRYGSPEEV